MVTSSTSGSTFREPLKTGFPGVLLALLLSGCQPPGPADDLDDYTDRMARVLDQRPPALPPVEPVPPLPSPREFLPRESMDHQDQPGSIDILDFIALGQCELQQLVAAHNSTLGRLATPSQRLVYELNFLRAGDACALAIAENEPELAATIGKVLASKRDGLPGTIWQATLGGPELRRFWQRGREPLPTRFESDGNALFALMQLNDDVGGWLNGLTDVDDVRLEQQLKVIGDARVGPLIRSWEVLAAKLEPVTQLVQARVVKKPLCYPGMHPQAADIFYNVVSSVFVGRIQVWAAGLNSRYYELLPPVKELELALAAGEPGAYQVWRESRDQKLFYTTQALARHVRALTPLMAECGFLPSASNDHSGDMNQ